MTQMRTLHSHCVSMLVCDAYPGPVAPNSVDAVRTSEVRQWDTNVTGLWSKQRCNVFPGMQTFWHVAYIDGVLVRHDDLALINDMR
jgi:hypothetical protein